MFSFWKLTTITVRYFVLNSNGISSTNDCKDKAAPLLSEWLYSSLDNDEYLPSWLDLFPLLKDWLIEWIVWKLID